MKREEGRYECNLSLTYLNVSRYETAWYSRLQSFVKSVIAFNASPNELREDCFTEKESNVASFLVELFERERRIDAAKPRIFQIAHLQRSFDTSIISDRHTNITSSESAIYTMKL